MHNTVQCIWSPKITRGQTSYIDLEIQPLKNEGIMIYIVILKNYIMVGTTELMHFLDGNLHYDIFFFFHFFSCHES